jgi:DnaJ-domain-containing protein 1
VGRSDLVKALYRLGRQAASGVVTIGQRGSEPALTRAEKPGTGAAPRDEILVLRRGAVMIGDSELARRTMIARLARLASLDGARVAFAGGVTAYPPGAQSQLVLAGWARAHLEQQLDGSLADLLVHELAGVRLSVRAELAPEANDEADRRMLAAMTQPRRLDQIWPLARTPRFRLLALLHFLRAVDALVVEGVASVRRIDSRRASALRLLGVRDDADVEEVKRAYRRLARALHPDLQPDADAGKRRSLELRFAEVTAAYEALR